MNDAIEHEKALKSELEKQTKELQRVNLRLREEGEETRLKNVEESERVSGIVKELKEKLAISNEELKRQKDTINWLNQ